MDAMCAFKASSSFFFVRPDDFSGGKGESSEEAEKESSEEAEKELSKEAAEESSEEVAEESEGSEGRGETSSPSVRFASK